MAEKGEDLNLPNAVISRLVKETVRECMGTYMFTLTLLYFPIQVEMQVRSKECKYCKNALRFKAFITHLDFIRKKMNSPQ